MHKLWLKGVGVTLCLICLFSCASSCRQWQIQQISTACISFNAGRLLLAPDSDVSHIELEMTRNQEGLRLYVNLLFLQAAPSGPDPACTKIEIQWKDQDEPWIVYPYLLEGGQRLLLPCSATERIVQALLEEDSFTIRVGRNHILVVPENFSIVYKQLMEIPFET